MIEGLADTLKAFNIVPKDLSLYEQAFTHASYTNEHPGCLSYDRLEFLGDSILDMVIADFLFSRYPESNSGALSKMRASLVDGKTLTEFSEKHFHLSRLVRYSVGESTNNRFHTHIDEDIFEAFIAATYLDQGYLFIRQLLWTIYEPVLDQASQRAIQKDSKSRLQELVPLGLEYVIVSQTNPNTPDCHYVVEVRVGGTVLGVGEGHNHKEAEVAAATDALSKKVGQ
ncbi:MAG: ribonuclease III [Bacilli bacterium]|jgi:ribonuclease-3|nr:ribonuclease III [Bacilli bacterium]